MEWSSTARPEPFLLEAYRVLTKDGVLLISVPYFHPLRRLKAWCGCFSRSAGDLSFYQYAFTRDEFAAILQRTGFRIVDVVAYDGFKSLKDELWLLRAVTSWPVVGWRLAETLRSWAWAERHAGHMVMFVCRKVQAPQRDAPIGT